MSKFIFGFVTGCLTTLCVVPLLLILFFGIVSSSEQRSKQVVSETFPYRPSVSANIDESTGEVRLVQEKK